jgi:hypothetical protein
MGMSRLRPSPGQRIMPALCGGLLALGVCLGDGSRVVHAQDAGTAEWANERGDATSAAGVSDAELNDSQPPARTLIERNNTADGSDLTGDARRQSWNWAWVPVGLAFGLWWLVSRLRRGKPRDDQRLPEGVIASLGRRSVGGGHVVQLIRIGSRILVVTPTAEGLRTLTDITDPAEVERLVGMCLQPAGATTGIAGLFGGRAIRSEAGERTARTARDERTHQPARTDEARPELSREAAR